MMAARNPTQQEEVKGFGGNTSNRHNYNIVKEADVVSVNSNRGQLSSGYFYPEE